MTNETPETPEARKAREKAEAAAKKAAEAAQKAREGKLKEKVELAATKRDLQKKLDALNKSQSGSTKQFTDKEMATLRDLEGRIARINEQITTIDKELGS